MTTAILKRLESVVERLERLEAIAPAPRGELPAKPGLLPVKEAAGMMGVSKRTVERMVERGEIRPVRIGRLVKFRRNDVEKVIHGKTEVSR